MCMCAKPTVNGQPGYRWNTPQESIREINAPELQEGEELVYDLPGRCGRKSDSHSYHFRIVRMHGEYCTLTVRHGGGDERIELSHRWKLAFGPVLESLDDDGRYWLLCSIYHTVKDAARAAADKERAMWRQAAAEKRIKTRKLKAGVRVTVLPAVA